jgi:hypothetical protein
VIARLVPRESDRLSAVDRGPFHQHVRAKRCAAGMRWSSPTLRRTTPLDCATRADGDVWLPVGTGLAACVAAARLAIRGLGAGRVQVVAESLLAPGCDAGG